jgi:hypothetical protein
MISFDLKEGRMSEYQSFLKSDEARKMFDKLEKATGFKYVQTYFSIIPTFGDYDCYEIWEFPDLAAFDKARETNAFEELFRRTYDMTDTTAAARGKSVLLRTATDVKIIYEPPTKP